MCSICAPFKRSSCRSCGSERASHENWNETMSVISTNKTLRYLEWFVLKRTESTSHVESKIAYVICTTWVVTLLKNSFFRLYSTHIVIICYCVLCVCFFFCCCTHSVLFSPFSEELFSISSCGNIYTRCNFIAWMVFRMRSFCWWSVYVVYLVFCVMQKAKISTKN